MKCSHWFRAPGTIFCGLLIYGLFQNKYVLVENNLSIGADIGLFVVSPFESII